jgi:hypothetical protein
LPSYEQDDFVIAVRCHNSPGKRGNSCITP